MSGLARRLRSLEESAGSGRSEEEREIAVQRKALGLMSTADLHLCEAAMVRRDAGEEFTPEDLEVMARFTQLREAVTNGDLTDD